MYVTLEHLAQEGMGGLSIAAIAAEAGTTRPAIYRRWRSKVDLVVAAVAWTASTDVPPTTGVPYTDLVLEMEHYRHCISDIGVIALAGAMMAHGVQDEVRTTYAERIARPRWDRIVALLERATTAGELPAGADTALGASLLTGSWYGYAWTSLEPPPDWPERIVEHAWRALGGDPGAARRAEGMPPA